MSVRKLLPTGVHVKFGRYYRVKHNKWTGLSRVAEGLSELYRRLALLDPTFEANTLAAIFADYEATVMRELAPSTQRQYADFFAGILGHHFGHMMPIEVDTGHIAQFLESRKNAGSPASGNRARAALSSAFEHAMRTGRAKANPCRGVRRNKESADRTLIASADLSAAIDRAPPHFARALQFAYLTGVRQSDIVSIEVGAVRPAGIEFVESKTKKPVTIEWTPALRGLVREILEARQVAMTRPYANKYRRTRELPQHERLFINRFGKPLTEWAVQSCMRRLEVDWTFRKVRPKAQTDGGDRNVLGHEGQMRRRYTRRLKLVPVR